MKIVIAGGSGYLGRLLIEHFSTKNHQIVVLSRSSSRTEGQVKYVTWNGEEIGDWANELENTDALINLSGKNINCSFTANNRAALISSRIKSTQVLGKAINLCQKPPKIWLNASSVAYFKETYSVSATENFAQKGDDFLSELSHKWEETFHQIHCPATVKTIFRISLILGEQKGSALLVLKKLIKSGGGGKAGNGKQMVSWMGEKDFVEALSFLISNRLGGVFNFCNTSALSNSDFMRELRRLYGMPFGVPTPEFLLRIGAKILDTAPDLVLRSQNVFPENLLNAGFEFKQNKLDNVIPKIRKFH